MHRYLRWNTYDYDYVSYKRNPLLCMCMFNKEVRIPLVLLIYCSLHANCYSCIFCYKNMALKMPWMYIVHVCILSSELKLIHTNFC